MATNMYKKYTESLTREWVVPSGTQAGTVVLHANSNQVGITLTARGDSTRAAGIPGVTGGTPASQRLGPFVEPTHKSSMIKVIAID